MSQQVIQRYKVVQESLTPEESLFAQIQSTKFILVMLIFIVSSVFVYLKTINPSAYASICAWIVSAYVVGDIGGSWVSALTARGLVVPPVPLSSQQNDDTHSSEVFQKDMGRNQKK